MSACSKVVLSIVVLLIVLGIGGMICGAYGSYWYTSSIDGINNNLKHKHNFGLWKTCTHRVTPSDTATTCEERKIFKFSKEENFVLEIELEVFDIVLILLVGSGGLACVALVFGFIMCCLGDSSSTWRGISSPVVILTLVAAGAAVGAVVFAEIKIRRDIPKSQINLYEHGWSSLLSWVGAGSFFLAFIMSIVMCCNPPKKRYRDSRTSAYTTETGFSYKSNPNGGHSAYNTMTDSAGNTTNGRNNNRHNDGVYENSGYQLR